MARVKNELGALLAAGAFLRAQPALLNELETRERGERERSFSCAPVDQPVDITHSRKPQIFTRTFLISCVHQLMSNAAVIRAVCLVMKTKSSCR
jgi:hypothetical protein